MKTKNIFQIIAIALVAMSSLCAVTVDEIMEQAQARRLPEAAEVSNVPSLTELSAEAAAQHLANEAEYEEKTTDLPPACKELLAEKRDFFEWLPDNAAKTLAFAPAVEEEFFDDDEIRYREEERSYFTRNLVSSPDGSKILITLCEDLFDGDDERDWGVLLIDTQLKQVLRQFPNISPSRPPEFSSDSKKALLIHGGTVDVILDTSTGSSITEDNIRNFWFDGSIESATFDAEGNRLLISFREIELDHHVFVLAIDTGDTLASIPLENDIFASYLLGVQCAKFSRDETKILICSGHEDNTYTLTIVDAGNGNNVIATIPHGDRISIEFTDDANIVRTKEESSYFIKKIRTIDLTSGEIIQQEEINVFDPFSGCRPLWVKNSNGSKILKRMGKTFELIDVASNEVLAQIQEDEDIKEAIFGPDSKTFLIKSGRMIKIFDATSVTVLMTFELNSPRYSIAEHNADGFAEYTSDGTKLIVCKGNTVTIQNLYTFEDANDLCRKDFRRLREYQAWHNREADAL